MASNSVLAPRSVFAGLAVPLEGRGISVIERDGLGLACVQAGAGKLGSLQRRVHESFGIDLPGGPAHVSAGDVAFAGTGPGTWLASHETGGNAFAASLSRELGDCAAVTDQSDGLGLLRLSGPRVRDVLCRLVPVDVHEREFRIGGVASTLSGHTGVILWRLEDRSGATPVFEIALPRSVAGTFARALGDHVARLEPVFPM